METKEALKKYGLGEMSGTEVVAQCPRLAELEPDLQSLADAKNLSQHDRDEVRAFQGLLLMLGDQKALTSAQQITAPDPVQRS